MPYTPPPPTGPRLTMAELGRRRLEEMQRDRQRREDDAREKKAEAQRLHSDAQRRAREAREAELKAARKGLTPMPQEKNPFTKQHLCYDEIFRPKKEEPEKFARLEAQAIAAGTHFHPPKRTAS